MSDARRLAGMVLNGWSKRIVDRRNTRHEKDIGCWNSRWSSMFQRHAGTFTFAQSFDIPCICDVDENLWMGHLHDLFWKNCEESTEE